MTAAEPAPKMKIASGVRDSAQARLAELTDLLLPYAIRGLATLGVADTLVSGPLPIEAIAKEVDADAAALYRTMRYAATRGVFVEFPNRVFALTSLANWLRSDTPGSMRPGLMIDDGLTRRVAVFAEVLHTLRTGEPAYRTGTEPAGGEAPGPQRRVRAGAQRRPAALADAVGLAAGAVVVDVDGDSLAAVPAGADAYVLSFVLHELPDDLAATALATVGAAMRDDSRLLVVEGLISDDGEQAEPAVRQDFMMLLHGGGRARTADELTALVAQAGLRLVNESALGSGISVLEAATRPPRQP